ncbi:P-loop containing nucleoside triphosphate hydrolase protein [Aspergillus germanicus]
MADVSNSTCLWGGQPVTLGSGFSCPDGFHCPWSDESQPVFCPPSPDCLLRRLKSSANICIKSQGDFEPVICRPGYYCPPPGTQQLPCPSGHFCPLGTVTPFKCTALSVCAEGSSHETPLLALMLCVLLDILFSLDLTFTGINLRLGRPPRDILCNVHGTIRSGSVFGIIGASGSGKSSLVRILSGRSRPTQGCIAINGRPSQPDDLRNMIGFIPQHDIVPPDLTVRENILYSGRVLLGNRMPAAEIEAYIDSLISSLGLHHIRHSQVGSLLKQGGRGISGGEYKRVSIALALAGAPTALVLDEPTSGLDATAAHSLMKLLHGISRRGIIVICVIHQPRVEIFDLLDDLLVLNSGSQMYLGKAAEAQGVFEKLGHTFPKGSNPADVILDILINEPHIGDGGLKNTLGMTPSPSVTVAEESVVTLLQILKDRKTSWPRQLWLAFQRSIIQQSRQTAGIVLEIGSSSIVGLMVGLSAFESRGHLFQGLYHDPFDLLSSAVDYRTVVEQALLCCIAISCAAGPAGVKVFGEEKETFHRESQSGHSRSAYFLGKNLAVCFRILISSLHFTAFYLLLAAPMISLRLQLALVFLHYYCIYGLGFIVSSLVRREDGPLLCMLLSLITSALSGSAPRLSTVRDWHLVWFWYAWPATWFSEAFLQENIDPLGYLYEIKDAFAFTGYEAGRTGMDIGLMILVGTTYRLLSYTLFMLWGWKSQH